MANFQQPINDLSIQEFDCESLSANIIDNFNKNKNFKILKIQNCKSVLALLKKMDEENFKTSFKNRSHLFIIVIETSENLNDVDPEVLSLLGSIFDQLEHFVVEIIDGNKRSMIYYKDSEWNTIEKNSGTTRENVQSLMGSENRWNFSILIQALHSKILGEHDGNLLSVKLKRSELKSEILFYAFDS